MRGNTRKQRRPHNLGADNQTGQGGMMATIREERERMRRELHAVLERSGKSIEEALTIDYDRKHRIRQRWLLFWSNVFLMIAGSEFRVKIQR